VTPIGCKNARSRNGYTKGRERPRLWLPRACLCAGRSRPWVNRARPQQDHNLISSGFRTDQVWIRESDTTGTVKQKTMSKFKIEKGLRTITGGRRLESIELSRRARSVPRKSPNDLLGDLRSTWTWLLQAQPGGLASVRSTSASAGRK
jgi:hypothetical protein